MAKGIPRNGGHVHRLTRCNACGKRCYDNERLANKELRKLAKRDDLGHLLRAYRCGSCLYWHIGHKSQREN